MNREMTLEEARAIMKRKEEQLSQPGMAEKINKMRAENKAFQDERNRVFRPRYARFVRAMTRLGCADHRKINPDLITAEIVLDQILMDGDGGDEFWSINEVKKELRHYCQGSHSLGAIGPELGENIERIIRGELGNGDVLNEALTPTAVLESLDHHFKERVPLFAVRAYMFRAQEKELLRRRLRSPAPAPADVTKEVEVSPYMREKILESENNDRKCRAKYQIFLTAVRQLGGVDNISNITTEAVYNLITQEMDGDASDLSWSMSAVTAWMMMYKIGGSPVWRDRHHNRMLEAIERLGGDPFNEGVVNPKDVLKLMLDGDDTPPMTVTGVEHNLKKLRYALKMDPNHPLGCRKKPTKPMRPFNRWTPEEILALASEDS